MSQAQKIAGARRSKKYKALIETLKLSDPAALAVLGYTVEPAEPEVDPRVTRLIETGAFSLAEAEEAVRASETAPEEAPTDEPAEADEAPAEPEQATSGGDVELTSEQVGNGLVEAQGLTFTKGRVYLTADAVEAMVRVRKTGSPEIIQSSGVGRTKAVLFFRMDSGDVAAQNLTKTA